MDMYKWAQDMWTYPRSITGVGVRQTLNYIGSVIPELRMHSVPSGTPVFDWTVPKEFICREAYIEENGRRIIDFRDNNLHVIGYSSSINSLICKDELQKHLYSIEDKPDAIPYITSYYKDRWGFCLTQKQRDNLGNGPFRVVIDSEKFDGQLDYADIVIPGNTDDEIMLSTYICHPSMANDNLSGIVVAMALAKSLIKSRGRKYTYRIVFVPETIGSLVYLSTRLNHLRRYVKAGYVITCCGDAGELSYLYSRYGDTLSDRAAKLILPNNAKMFDYKYRGSDERQYCWPRVDLPIGSIMRTKYGTYDEYHTSLDDLSFISQEKLDDTLNAYKEAIYAIERNHVYAASTQGEPFLSKHGYYPDVSPNSVPDALNILAYCDGRNDLISICTRTGIKFRKAVTIINQLREVGLVVKY